jgi:hypothetical protein
MNSIIYNFEKIKKNINNNVNIIAVSKSFNFDHIKPLLIMDTFILEKTKFKKHYINGQILKKKKLVSIYI